MLVGGQILDETGLPLPGVNIYYTQINNMGSNVIGANFVKKGTTTEVDGSWQLPIEGINPKVKISFIGYKTLEYYADQIPHSIKMQVDSSMINNVTVVGKAKTAGMGLAGKLLFGALILAGIAKAIPGIIADNNQGKKGLKGFKKVSL